MEHSQTLILTKFSFFIIIGTPKGYDKVWLIGDDFVAQTYQQYFVRMETKDSYIKQNFEVSAFFNNALAFNRSSIGRLQNALAAAINQQNILPKLVVYILENDVINCLPKEECEETTLLIYKKVFRSMATFTERAFATLHESLPAKCMREGYPHILWIQPIIHDDLKLHDEFRRKTFKQAMTEVVPEFTGMSTLELKQIWDESDSTQLLPNKPRLLSAKGNCTVWRAIDRTVKYCDTTIFKSLEFIRCPTCFDRIGVKMMQRQQREKKDPCLSQRDQREGRCRDNNFRRFQRGREQGHHRGRYTWQRKNNTRN